LSKSTKGEAKLIRRVDRLWEDEERRRPGPKPALDTDQIVERAVGIADRRGLPAVTMNRVAHELGFTTMALYRHLNGKAELLDRMLEEAVGRPPEVDPDRGWRANLETWARANLAIFQRHPWAFHAAVTPTVFGPNRLAWLEAALSALSDTGMPPAEMMATVSLVDDLVRGAAQVLLILDANPQFNECLARAMVRAEQEGGYPTLARLGTRFLEDDSGDYFEFGLQRVLDSLEASLADPRPTSR